MTTRTAAALALALAAGLAPAQSLRPRVAIVSASTYSANSQAEPRFTDPRDAIVETGLVDSCDIIPATNIGDGIGTPTLLDLMQYEAVITWSNQSYADGVAMGNVLADYVDSGGGVVVAVHSNTSANTNRFLEGRWQDPAGGYIAIQQNGGFNQGTPSELGERLVPDHPILTNVGVFRNKVGIGTTGPFGAWRVSRTDVLPGSELVARWTTGEVLIAVAPNPKVVELGFHPVSNNVNDGYWDHTTDGGLIMANALLFAAGRFDDDCVADITGEGDVNTNDFFAYLALYQAQDAAADITGEGDINTNDFFAYLAAYQAGC